MYLLSLITLSNPTHFFYPHTSPLLYLNPLHPLSGGFFTAQWAGGQKPLSSFSETCCILFHKYLLGV